MGIKSEYLDLAVGLAVVFFLASLVVSGLNEALQWVTRIRAKFLWAFLHDLTDPKREKAMPRGRLGILSLWRRRDRRPIVDGTGAELASDDLPDWLLQRLARALDPIDAPEMVGASRRTAISHVPPASLTQAFMEVFAEVGRERMDTALVALAAALMTDDDPVPVISRLAEGVGNDAKAKGQVLEALTTLTTQLRAATTVEAAEVAGRDFASALLAIQGARPGPSPGKDLREAGAELAAAVFAARAGTAGVDAVSTEARELSSAIIGTFPDRFGRQRIEIALAHLGDAPIGPTTRRIWESAAGQIDDFRLGLEEWFDSEMTRLSGYYKRSIRLLLGILAALVAVTANIDAIQLTNHLWQNPEGRASLVARADEVIGTAGGPAADALAPSLERLQQECQEAAPTQEEEIRTTEDAARAYGEVRECVSGALDELSGLNVIDRAVWTDREAWLDDWDPNVADGWPSRSWVLHVLGVIATTLALLLGAPFWFDLLKRITGIRRGLVGRT